MKPFCLAAIGLALTCGGCATTYAGVDVTTTPSAMVSFSKGYKSGFGVSGGQAYALFTGSDCMNPKMAANLLWTTPKTKTIPIAAGQRVVISATTTYYYTTSVGMINGAAVANVDNTGCVGTASFVPEVGHSYEVVQAAPFRGPCPITVIDKATGEAPPTFSRIRNASCAVYFDPEGGALHPNGASPTRN